MALIRAARTSAIHGDSADFQRYLLVPGVPAPSHPSTEPAATHGSGPSHHEILEASGMDRHPKGMWPQLGFACDPLCSGAEPFPWSPACSTPGGAAGALFPVPFSAESAQKQSPACAPRPGRSSRDGVSSAQLPPGPWARPEAAGPQTVFKIQRGE